MHGEKSKKDSTLNGKICGNCFASEGSASAPKLSACSRCGLVVYCSRDCQRAHWKADHREHCIAKAERALWLQNSVEVGEGASSSTGDTAITTEKCAICQDFLTEISARALPCTHVFHESCVTALRKYGVQQACPLCRGPLLSELQELNEKAVRKYMVVNQLIERGYASWSTLPEWAQQELDNALSDWRTAAQGGCAHAQYNMATLLIEGKCVVKNNMEAVKWYKKSAEQGHAQAQCKLGSMHCEGLGVTRNDVAAARWYKLAANQGDSEAQGNLGFLFQSGRGVEQSDEEAVKWFMKAADQGFAGAQCNLGLQFMNGCVVAQSDVKAAQWFRKAADQGFMEAQHLLGTMYASGRGVKQSYLGAAN